jgi:hypothetical protein
VPDSRPNVRRLRDPDVERRLVWRAGNPFDLPAEDRSGRLDVTEPPDLGALLYLLGDGRGAGLGGCGGWLG